MSTKEMKYFIFLLASFVVVAAYTIPDKNLEHNLELSDNKECECENGRCVFDNRGKAKCSCYPKFAPTDEKTCKPCDCGTKGKCLFLMHRQSDGTVQYQKKCICDKGSAERDGTCIDCQCGENSQCEFEGEEKICYCLEGYSEKNGICTECDCGEYGDCKFENNYKTCTCFENFLVLNGRCEENPCLIENGDCEHQCAFENGVKTCSCNEKYELQGDGKSCIENPCFTNNGECQHKCEFVDYFKKCSCDEKYVLLGDGSSCIESCYTNRDCREREVCGELGFCICKDGYEGDTCSVITGCKDLELTCERTNAKCVYDENVPNKANCECLKKGYKYDVKSKICRIPCGDFNLCDNSGKCVEYGTVSFCSCQPGTSGDRCEIVNECRHLDCGPDEDVTCAYDEWNFKAFCKCHDVYKKYDPNVKECRIPCDESTSCSSSAECVGDDVKFCKCNPGTSGDQCEVVEGCSYLDCGTGKGVKCDYDVQKEKAFCKCDHSDKKFDPYQKECRSTCEVDGFSYATCNNGGVCGGYLDFFCKCLAGTSGDFCEIVDECKKNPTKCKNGAACVFDVKKQEAVCMCKSEREQYDPYSEQCKSTCDDETRKCSYGGKCGHLNFCYCLPGTSGDFCELIDDCSKVDDNCHGDAYCDYDIDKQKAFCRCKYAGEVYDPWSQKCKRTCDETSNLCSNGGFCPGTGDFSFCKCLPGTRGDMCEIVDECEKNKDKCKDGAVCAFNVVNEEATCLCENDGETYDPRIERCKKSCAGDEDCYNGGLCKKEGRNQFCECLPGTSGDLCNGITDCITGVYRYCRGDNGTCTFNVIEKKSKCECSDGKTFDDSSKICRACDCGRYSVSCRFSNGTKTCTCADGYTDINGTCETCSKNEEIVDCAKPKWCNTCGIRGNCKLKSCLKGCDCKTGYYRDDKEVCIPESQCPEEKCIEKSCHDGKCEVVVGQEVCSCFEGYVLEGDSCKKLNCSRTACIKGTCVVRYGNVEECVCPAGFTLDKDTCKRGLCKQETCFGGQCQIVQDELVCVCPERFHLDGIGCYETQCTDNHCYGGKCEIKDGEEICTCLEGYILENHVCKQILCLEKSCFGGKCSRIDGIEECTCPKGFTLFDDVCREDYRGL